MDIQPTTQQPISDDQELAKVLAGIDPQNTSTPQYEETPISPSVAPTNSGTSTNEPVATPDEPAPAVEPVTPTPAVPSTPPAPQPASNNLEDIKKDALLELRPLVDKLNISPEEKFDTYLLLIRSTDDTSLIAPAHAAAAAITDETRRAQALLDIIKEIDYLTNPQPAA